MGYGPSWTRSPALYPTPQKLTKSWAEIDAETVRATCDPVIPRLHQVIEDKGGYIE